MATFGGIFIGSSAIHAAQRGLDVTGQNVSNSATPGYTRQRADLESVGGPGVPAFWSRYDGTGEGVRVTGVSRLTDSFLVARANDANASLGSLEEQAKTSAALERTLGEPSSTGLQKQMQEFWNSWAKIGTDPKGDAPRNLVFENAHKVANQLNHMAKATQTQYEDSVEELKANVTDVNVMAKDIARLNDAIRNNNIARVPTNELLDQRDLLISRVAELTGAIARPAELDQGSGFRSDVVDVFIGDQKLVDGLTANELDVTAPAVGDLATVEGAATVTLGGVNVANGRIGGQVKGINTDIPAFAKQLDAVAVKFAETVNTQHTSTTTHPTYTVDGAQGGALYTGTTAADIRVAAGLTARDLAISTGNPKDPDPAKASIDANNALAMSKHLGDANGPDAIYRGLVVQVGVGTQSVNRNVEVQRNVVMKAEDARDNVSGVSLNEEMTNMIRFQHSFSAAAKYVGVIDQTLETLINMVR